MEEGPEEEELLLQCQDKQTPVKRMTRRMRRMRKTKKERMKVKVTWFLH